jgi:hypothetical protein
VTEDKKFEQISCSVGTQKKCKSVVSQNPNLLDIFNAASADLLDRFGLWGHPSAVPLVVWRKMEEVGIVIGEIVGRFKAHLLTETLKLPAPRHYLY